MGGESLLATQMVRRNSHVTAAAVTGLLPLSLGCWPQEAAGGMQFSEIGFAIMNARWVGRLIDQRYGVEM